METRLVELYVERGRLRERIRMQRGELARELAPVAATLHSMDSARAWLHRAGQWMAAHPGVVVAAAVAVVVWKPRAVLRTGRWALSAWRNWAHWRSWIRAGLKVL